MPRARVTTSDIARMAGVSRATVSYVLNGQSKVPVAPSTRERVLKAAYDLGYKPDPLARGLLGQQTFTLGHVVGSMDSNQVWVDIARSVQVAARSAGYDMLLTNGAGDPEEELRQVRLLLDRAVDGFFFNGPLSAESCSAAIAAGVPTVLLERYPQVAETLRVRTDNYTASWLATQHLLDLGHLRIAYIGLADLEIIDRERFAGTADALRHAGTLLPDAWTLRVPNQDPAPVQEFVRRLVGSPHRPTAIYAGGNLFAIAVLQALAQSGLRVPKDISLVAYDEQFALYTEPPLTTISAPAEQIGEVAVHALLEQMGNDGGGQREGEVLLQPVLRVRGSTAPAPDRVAVSARKRVTGAPADKVGEANT